MASGDFDLHYFVWLAGQAWRPTWVYAVICLPVIFIFKLISRTDIGVFARNLGLKSLPMLAPIIISFFILYLGTIYRVAGLPPIDYLPPDIALPFFFLIQFPLAIIALRIYEHGRSVGIFIQTIGIVFGAASAATAGMSMSGLWI